MGLGDAPTPVPSDTPANNPAPTQGEDKENRLDDRLRVLERVGNDQLLGYVKYLYDLLSEPFPPP